VRDVAKITPAALPNTAESQGRLLYGIRQLQCSCLPCSLKIAHVVVLLVSPI
jgi:hypothetical protein